MIAFDSKDAKRKIPPESEPSGGIIVLLFTLR